MADYIKAFKQGLEAALVADRARKEIDEVFADLNNQLSKETKNKICIERREYEKGHTLSEVLKNPFLPLSGKSWVIVVFDPSVDESPVKKLAIWSMDRAGYPCKIVWKNVDVSCEDKEALENSLSDLLRDPLVGEKLHSLIQMWEIQPE